MLTDGHGLNDPARIDTPGSAIPLLPCTSGGRSSHKAQDRTCAPTYEGYLVAGGELRTLPVGASLDAAGRFYWQPGAGFVGAYQLLFVKTACDGTRTRIPVDVRIGPR